jgi:predicted RNase H-like nuclease (RuvC/YqgF family)
MKINKEIIEDFYRTNKNKDSASYVNKLKEEINLLNKMNDDLKDEIISLRNKLAYYEQITNNNLLNHGENTEALKNKIFILENTIIKKDNMMLSLKSKLNKLLEKELLNDYINFDKETIVKFLI